VKRVRRRGKRRERGSILADQWSVGDLGVVVTGGDAGVWWNRKGAKIHVHGPIRWPCDCLTWLFVHNLNTS
jgi:hypothetical protein